MITEIITSYVVIDDLLKAVGHREDRRCQLSDAEVITAALVAARFFSGNESQACTYLKEHGWIPHMLGTSRFSRRWHRLFLDLLDLFDDLGMVFKALKVTGEYLLDSFPVALCDNIRIPRVRLVRSEDYRGYIASKKRYFYGIRVQLLCTKTGLPVEFVFLPGEANDTRGLSALPLNLPAGSQVYSDAGYTDYQAEDDLQQTDKITLQVMRKRHAKRPDPPWVSSIKQHLRHPIETVFSRITQRFPKSMHAVTMDGFLLKVTAFSLAFTLEAALVVLFSKGRGKSGVLLTAC